ncbi:protein associated with UVRAG as autophagy enhancer [Lampris incognitus]|uniref:protein associated with UVRAG as autophagy enhancer n=1 Tax=Lampris incognitus TaxID=2546036 RepID=UPI0024B583C3|nr:protein associated with UVRAG as autophagy enhancer [Lampris incognitus]
MVSNHYGGRNKKSILVFMDGPVVEETFQSSEDQTLFFINIMDSHRGSSPSLQRCSYASWSVDSETMALTTPEISGGLMKRTSIDHPPPMSVSRTRTKRQGAFRNYRPKSDSNVSKTKIIFSKKHTGPHDNGKGTHDGEDESVDQDDYKEIIRPTDAHQRSQEDPSLQPREDEGFHLPRSSPVISRRRRSLSWHGAASEPSLSSSCFPSTSSGEPTLGHDGGHTALRMEEITGTSETLPSPDNQSVPLQENRKPRCVSASSNLSSLLFARLHLPLRIQQVLGEDCWRRDLRQRCSSDVYTRPVTTHYDSQDKRFSDLPQRTSDIFRTSCELEKENAHFIVVDMVLEVLEGVKWTLTFSQWTSTNTETYQHTDCSEELALTQKHTRKSETGPYQPAQMSESSNVGTYAQQHTLSEEGGPGNANRACAGEDTHKSEEDSHTNSHVSKADMHIHPHTHKEEEPDNHQSAHQLKTLSVLSTDSGFEDCGIDKILTERGSLRNVEWLGQQLVLGFRRSWLPSRELHRDRHSLRTSLQELPGTSWGEVSSSLTEEIRLRTRMRGTLIWAPPRFQIIYTVHPTHRRSEVLALQHFLCAGCGTGVEPKYIKKLRYCEYLGRYFCDCCHGGSEALIPGRVLLHWDFGRYPVSDFSKQLLDSTWHLPLFDLTCVGKQLYSKVRELDKFRELQKKLLSVKRLLTTCRLSGRVMSEFEQLPGHLTQQPHLFSMDDLLRVKKGQLVPLARAVLSSATDHVDDCKLCLGRGFICEFCRERDILFPFQGDTCKRCPVCKACFHKGCFMEKNCPKCERIHLRRKVLDEVPSHP